ncbi:MAG: thiamine phosphate synthase [Thermoleophilia bacterium]|nr:thiamine phosphate synthase [Thermoleophilia bacterium]
MLADRRLYLVTGVRPDLPAFLEAAVAGGVDVVQVRERGLTDRELLAALEQARAVTARLGVPFVVNDRADLALLAGADLLHVGQDDLPVAAARRLGLRVGLSTHAPAEIDAADADYIGVGPVHATPTKLGRPAVGLDLVRYAAAHARQPWFAIGGIDATNVADVVAAGATRIAVVRAIGDAADPERAARELRAALGA